ncbi:hypothetical protein NECAME_13513 [Necator americanus]|uniref:Uncharacterized protein n=1 Tax=Necator americanus TaxID=51031 RepID=W2SVC8_NECAM|nr:hypothetical protein NECAME_13513 [Necator americanus]ETN73478.1 hypothetical protein NECAME_13513 [Necator americanus]
MKEALMNHGFKFLTIEELGQRNARQLAGSVPRTNTTCNSRKLANVMVRVMVDDVSFSKRAVLRATEIAFDGDKNTIPVRESVMGLT